MEAGRERFVPPTNHLGPVRSVLCKAVVAINPRPGDSPPLGGCIERRPRSWATRHEGQCEQDTLEFCSTLFDDSDLTPVSRFAASFAGSAEICWSAYYRNDESSQPDKRMKNIPLASVPVVFAGLSHAALSAQERAPVIDMHMHAHHIPLDLPAGAPPPCLPRPCQPEGAATATPEESLRKTLEAMDRHNIVLGFLSSADLGIVQKWVAAAPDRFIASPFIEKPGDLTPQMLRQEYAAGRLAGMGEIGSQLMGVAPNDPALAPYFALAEEFDVPVLIHTEGIGPPVPGFRSAAGRPLLLEEVLVRHRNLRVFVENSGYPFLDEMIAMMYQYPQLYGDLSTITWVIPRSAFHRYVEALVRAGLGNRLMFGSDQMRWPEKIDEAIEAIEEADYLTAEQKRDILYNNAARFLRLERGRK